VRRSVIIKTSPDPAIDAIFTLREPHRATNSQRLAVLPSNGRHLLDSMSYSLRERAYNILASSIDRTFQKDFRKVKASLSRLTPGDDEKRDKERRRKEGIFCVLLADDRELHPFPCTRGVLGRCRSDREMTRVGMRDRRNPRALRMRRLGRKKAGEKKSIFIEAPLT